jgi:hypothetical chaperone protein
MNTTFGLDFGTTNSALSVSQDGQVEVVDIDEYNTTGKTLRSVIYFDEENKIFVGQEAIQNYIDNGAAGRFMQSIKSFLPSEQFENTYINRKRYELDDLIAIILRKIKEKGEEYVGYEVDDVVLGRPVVFSENEEKDNLAEARLRSAAEKAGFKNIRFQLEPIAAAFTFEETLGEGEEKKVLIGDFGGGTSDLTVIKLRSRSCSTIERKNDVLALGGVYIGGDSFNSRIMREKITKYFGRDVKCKMMGKEDSLGMPLTIMENICQWHLIPQLRDGKTRAIIRQIKNTADDKAVVENLENLIVENFGFMLFQAIEKAKCELSSLENSRIIFREWALSISEAISRIEFESMNRENVEKIAHCADETIKRSGLTLDQIDTVFITGGTSHIPCIQKLFIDRFGREKLRQMDAFTSVVHGLGASASFLF